MSITLLITDIHPQSDSTVTVRTNNPDTVFEYWASGDAKYSVLAGDKWVQESIGKPLRSIKYNGDHLIIDAEHVLQYIIEPLHKGDPPVHWLGKQYGI